MTTSLPELAVAYLRHMRTLGDDDLWAAEEVHERLSNRGDRDDAWAVVLALVAAADETNLDVVGAGPLEDFVRRYGAGHIVELERLARRDEKFLACLGTIWLDDKDLPRDVLARIVHASAGRIKPSKPGAGHDV